MTSLLALLRQNHNYRNTWLGQVVSETGDYYQILPPKGSTAWIESTWVVTRTSRRNAALVAAPVHVTNRRSCFAAISSSITAASYSRPIGGRSEPGSQPRG